MADVVESDHTKRLREQVERMRRSVVANERLDAASAPMDNEEYVVLSFEASNGDVSLIHAFRRSGIRRWEWAYGAGDVRQTTQSMFVGGWAQVINFFRQKGVPLDIRFYGTDGFRREAF